MTKYLQRLANKLFALIVLSMLSPFAIAANTSPAYANCPIDYKKEDFWRHATNKPKFSLAHSSPTDSLISADKIRYLGASKEVQLEGSAYIRKDELEVYSDSLIYHRKKQSMQFSNAYATYQGLRFWSHSGRVKTNQDMQYQQAIFSRCEGGYDTLAWEVKASKVEYHSDDESISLYNSRLYFHRVPIFYFPWLNIPLTRRSGLLFPKIGQKRLLSYDWEGYFYSQPLFIDLGVNMDATVGFSWLQDRSLLYSNQFRYRAPWIDLEINHDWKESDAVLEKVQEKAVDYSRLSIYTKSKLSSRWRLDSQWLELSPRLFHELFPKDILEKPKTGSFNRQVQLKGNYGRHQYGLRVYQNISLKNKEQDSYLGLPNLSYQYKKKLSQRQQFSFALSGERLLTPEERSLRNYQYAQIKPTWKWSDYRGFYHSYAELGVYRTHYEIDSFIANNGMVDDKQTVDYSNGYFKLGGELHLNNTQAWFPSSLYAKLSPILYYIYSPYKDPESIPFASYSAKKIDAFRSLLQVNRYNRADFIGESNRVVSGISQSLFSHSWRLRATLGKNNDIVKPTTATSLPEFDSAFSYWFGELAYNYGLFRANLNTQWEQPNDDSPKRVFSQLYYEDNQKNVVRLNYSRHLVQASVEGLDDEVNEYVGLGLSQQWNTFRFAYQTDYRFSDHRINSYVIGLIYDSCCWQFSTVVDGESSSEDPEKINYTINLGLTLKGLVAVGSAAQTESSVYKAVTGNR